MSIAPENHVLLRVDTLRKSFPVRGGVFNRVRQRVYSVDNVSFTLHAGETRGIVGESGCGKSTTARLLMRLIKPDGGEIKIAGERQARGIGRRVMARDIQMVFQDSFSSLNPRISIVETIAFGPRSQGLPRSNAHARARAVLAQVGLDPDLYGRRFPHELSGGQRQRVNIARALALQPRILILDEAVSALDKSVGALILNLLADLKAELGLTYIFISHDLDVVRYFSDRVLVMYLGRALECGTSEAIYAEPLHPYTRALFQRCRRWTLAAAR